MLKKIILISLLVLPLFSCSNSDSYLFDQQSKLGIIERQDHQKCVSQGLDYGDWDEIITELYWRCRYELINARRVSNIVDVFSKNNAVVEQMSDEVLKNLSRAKYSVLAKMEDDIELLDHEKCTKIGYKLGIVDLDDDYYICRKDLILARIPPAPRITNTFAASALPKDKSKQYIAIANETINSNKEAGLIMEMMQKYPSCAGLNTKSNDFKKCSAASDESTKCLANIGSIRVKKDLQDKIYCQKQTFIQFPDNYALAKDKSASEIEKLKLEDKKKTDKEVKEEINTTLMYLQGERDLKNIGRYVDDGNNQEEKSKDKLYSRVELLRLRESFNYQCNKKMEDKLPEFIEQSSQSCLDIAKNWDK